MEEPISLHLSGPASTAAPVLEPFTFQGTGGEYFRIWVVNLALSVVTLGIYSAWAKVRRLEFFYRNTRLAGAGFDYHGSPVAILKGRIIGIILFGAYSIAGRLGPGYLAASFVVIAAVMPFLLSRALRFRCANSSYRGVRFGFHGSTAGAYRAFLLWPFFAVLSLFTLSPMAHQRIKRYEHSNASYGTTPFSIALKVGPFYGIYLAAALMIFAALFAAGMAIFGAALVAAIGGAGRAAGAAGVPRVPPVPSAGMAVAFGAIMVIYVIGILAAQAFVTSRVQNLVWDSTSLGPRHSFVSTVSALKLLGIVITNTLATVFTLGLYLPFAQVRMARYMIGSLSMVSTGSFDEFTAAEPEEVSALGEEAAGFFDVDIAF